MNRPLVSIIIPTHNGEKLLACALESAMSQTYLDSEIIVINDGSKDDSENIILTFQKKDSRIIYIKNEHNIGFVKSLNKGIGQARGEYIARLDDDDVWIDSQKLEKQIDFLETHTDYVLVGGGLIRIGSDRKEVIRYLFPQKDEDIRKTVLVDNLFAHSSVVFRKDTFVKVGGYDEQFGFFADRALWLELGCIGKFYNLPEYFLHYLDKEDSMTNYNSRNSNIRRKLKLNILLRQKYKKFYPGFYKSLLLCFASYLYSYLPYRQRLRKVIFILRTLIIGKPSYTYVKPK